MADPVPDSKTPAFAALALVVVGVVLGLTRHGILGGVIAGFGAIPACFGMWKGIQQETQGTLAVSVGALIVSLAAAAVLIVCGLIFW
jgi:hypothetical protein